jgi:endoglucanase
MRTWGVLATAALFAGLIGPLGIAGAPAATAAEAPAPTPVVSGNHILDSRTGDVFVPHGVNWPSFEYACEQGWGYSQDDDTKAAADAMASWHINLVRLPMNQDCWLGNGDNYGTVAGYKAALKAWVGILNSDGIAVILDLHWSAPAGHRAEGQYPTPDAQSGTFWSQVAAAYASNRSVIFDAFNEPYSIYVGDTKAFDLTWDCWENGGCAVPNVGTDQEPTTNGGTYTAVGMSALVSDIRAAGARQPILLGGIDYSNNLTGWLAHKPDDSQLIASWHNYPGQDCDSVNCWNSQILPVAASVPVVTGEFGETDGGSTFLTTFMNWADAHGIGYLPWAWWEVSADEGHDPNLYALVTGSNFTPRAPSGTAYHDHLATLGATVSDVPLVNPGFEAGTTGWHDHSTGVTLANGGVPANAHSGSHYLVATAKTAGRGFEQSVSTDVGVGDHYTATVWMRTHSASSEKIELALGADGGSGEHGVKTVTIGKTWKAYTVSMSTAKPGHTSVRLSIYLESSKRDIYVDDAAISVVG